MKAFLDTAGERLEFQCSLPWVADLIQESAGPALSIHSAQEGSILIRVEEDPDPFDVARWEPLSRDAWHRGSDVVIQNVCTSGFDMRLQRVRERPVFSFRWRPPRRERVASMLLRARFVLLARAVLSQYPAVWYAGLRRRAPLHASVCTAGPITPLLAGPGGLGKSTLIAGEVGEGGVAVTDNLCVADGIRAWGVVEPMRLNGGSGRKMPHGRTEVPLHRRVPCLSPDRLVILRRGATDGPAVSNCGRDAAVQALVAGTYMAGELTRYWGFAATLAAGAGLGDAHPRVRDVAQVFSARLPCIALFLPSRPGTSLREALKPAEVDLWS